MRLPHNRRDAQYVLENKNLPMTKIMEILNKYDIERYWHEAPSAVTGYHSRYSLKKHFEGSGNETKYGFELEIEYRGGGSAHEVAWKVHALAENTLGKGLIRMETDGSLSNGIEIISAPLSEIEWRLKYSKIYKFLKGLKRLGFVSHNPGSCGLHIHITRPDTKIIGKIENLVLKNKDTKEFWLNISRRKDRTNYARFERQRTNSGNKYFAINKLPGQTIEMRLFRGTLKPSSFFTSLESTFALVNFTTKMREGSWRQFVHFVHNKGKFPHFINFVAKNMGNDWRIPTPKPRIRLSAEQRAIRDAELQRKREEKIKTRQFKHKIAIDAWLSDISNSASYANLQAMAGYTYELRACQIIVRRGFTQEDKKLSRFVTPICFKSIPKEKYSDGRYRPTVQIKKFRGWGRSSSYSAMSDTTWHTIIDISGMPLETIERPRRVPPVSQEPNPEYELPDPILMERRFNEQLDRLVSRYRA